MIAAYCRVSTAEQKTDLQRRDIDAFIAAKGVGDVEYYIDQGCTGTNGNRPELRRLLADVRSGKVKLVVCWKLDRLFRSLKDLIATLQLFGELGVEFVALRDAIDLSTSAGRLMMHMIGAFAEFEAALIRDRTKAGMQAAKRRGVRIGRKPVAIDRALIEEMRMSGASVRQIALALNVSRSVIHRAIKTA